MLVNEVSYLRNHVPDWHRGKGMWLYFNENKLLNIKLTRHVAVPVRANLARESFLNAINTSFYQKTITYCLNTIFTSTTQVRHVWLTSRKNMNVHRMQRRWLYK